MLNCHRAFVISLVRYIFSGRNDWYPTEKIKNGYQQRTRCKSDSFELPSCYLTVRELEQKHHFFSRQLAINSSHDWGWLESQPKWWWLGDLEKWGLLLRRKIDWMILVRVFLSITKWYTNIQYLHLVKNLFWACWFSLFLFPPNHIYI